MSRKEKILIIDDDSDLQMLLRLRLEANGFEVLSAFGKDDAIAEAEKKPDAILLDIMLPGGSEGYSIFSQLKINELTKDIPIVFLTRKTEDKRKALELGGSYFIIKPFEAKDLLEKIHLAIAGKKEKVV